MKTHDFDKWVAGSYDPEAKEVVINGAKFLYDGKALYEKQPISKKEADKILENYPKREDWTYDPENLAEIEEKIAVVERENKKEVTLTIGNINAISLIKEKLDKSE